MIKSLKLGNTTFPINIIQGPLAGVSCAPFRSLTWRHGKPAFSCTEMLSCKTLLHQSVSSRERFVKIAPDEGPVCFQLSGSDPEELAEATKRVTQLGADLIDLNCGCPVNKIRSKGAGSRLLTNPQLLYKLILAMKNNTHVPVSIKIRVQSNTLEKFNQEIAHVVSDAGADFIVVHGRHWTEHYETPCNHDEIKFFVENLKIPVIGNGDISCAASLKKMFGTGCAGVMIGRAGVGQPWLIQKLISELKQESFIPPTPRVIGAIFIEHVQQLSILLQNEKFAILQARKFAKYYGRDLAEKMAFCEEVNVCEDLIRLENICMRYFV
ncbi:MAG: tRNA-dihydrouridine synthase family protein [Gammaproteobacteria bacterium]